MEPERATDRSLYLVSGPEQEGFLQGLVSNDVRQLKDGLVYAALLSPQGKYLADFFLVPRPDGVLIDVQSDLAAGLIRRLSMYKLRADVQIAPSALHVSRGLSPLPTGALADPRHPALGWRLYGTAEGGAPQIDWDAIRVAHCIPESGIELVPDDSYILEAGFERLHGVDFRKGCYVGQEVTARMKHKTEPRKGLTRVAISGVAAPGAAILSVDGKEAGQLFTRSGDAALAHLRFDRAEGPMTAEEAQLQRLPDN